MSAVSRVDISRVESAIQLIESIVNNNHSDNTASATNNSQNHKKGTTGALGTRGTTIDIDGTNTLSMWSAGVHTPYHFSPSSLLGTTTGSSASGGSGGGASSPHPPVRAWMVRAADRARALLSSCFTPLCVMVSSDVSERVMMRIEEYCEGLQVVMDEYSHGNDDSGDSGEDVDGGPGAGVVEDGPARHVAAFVDEALVVVQRVRALADGSYTNLALAQGQGLGTAGTTRGSGVGVREGGRGSLLFGEVYGASSVPVRPFDYSDADVDITAGGDSGHTAVDNSGGGSLGGVEGGVRPPFVALVQQGVAAVGAIQLHKITHALQAIERSLTQQQPEQLQQLQSQSQPPSTPPSSAAACALIREVVPPFASRVLAAQALMLHDLVLSYKSSGKFLYVVLRVFRTLLAKGLCSDQVTPYQHTLSIRLSIYPINTHSINTLYQYTISIHPINTLYQRTLPRKPINLLLPLLYYA